MKRPGRIRRVAKWAGVAICLVLIVCWGVSARWSLVVTIPGPGRMTSVAGIANGCLVAGSGAGHRDVYFAWQATRRGEGEHLIWLPRWVGVPPGTCWVPIWILLAIAGALTAWAWRLDRPRSGRCAQCGYDLRGLSDAAACPECGRPPAQPGVTPEIR